RVQGGAGRRTRFRVPSRRLQRILEPSGDHRGLVYSPAASVIWRALPPSRSMTKSWNRSPTLREKTIRFPSCDQEGQPSTVDMPETSRSSAPSALITKIFELFPCARRWTIHLPSGE